MKIAIDLMGSENSPDSIIKAIIKKSFKTDFVLIGKKTAISLPKNFLFIESKTVIKGDENPLFAIRKKRDSSIAIGIKLLKEKKVDAFVSAGSTGALLSFGKIYLKTLNKISRPALLATFPSKKNPISILDVGANIKLKSEFLKQSTILGVAYQKWLGNKNPSVALLNIGSEIKKGKSEIQKAYFSIKKLSEKSSFQFIGNLEGKEVFNGQVDVLITDGFTGNIFLKTSEGIANFILDKISSKKNCKDLFLDLKAYLHYEKYPGALLCGLDSIIIKCHGYSSIEGFLNGIKGAIHLVENNFIYSMKKLINNKGGKNINKGYLK